MAEPLRISTFERATVEEQPTTCHECCLSCEIYKRAKDKAKHCESYKERSRAVNRTIYKARKKAKQVKV